jgi:hypothetical protein
MLGALHVVGEEMMADAVLLENFGNVLGVRYK